VERWQENPLLSLSPLFLGDPATPQNNPKLFSHWQPHSEVAEFKSLGGM